MSDTSVPRLPATTAEEGEDAVDGTPRGEHGGPDDGLEPVTTADEPAPGPDPTAHGATSRAGGDGSASAPATATDEPAGGVRTEVTSSGAAAADARPSESQAVSPGGTDSLPAPPAREGGEPARRGPPQSETDQQPAAALGSVETPAAQAPAQGAGQQGGQKAGPGLRAEANDADVAGTPDTEVPDTEVPDSKVPDSKVPDTEVPDSGSTAGDTVAGDPPAAGVPSAGEATTAAPTDGVASSRRAHVSPERADDASDPLLEPTSPEPPSEAGTRRLVEALRPRVSRAQLAVALLLGLLGFALAVQVRATQQTGLAGLRQSDLVRVLDDVSERSARLQAEARELERTRDRLSTSSDGRRAAIEETRKRAETLGILAGTLAATGPGIELVIPDPRGEIGPDVLLDAVQELRDAGAEAIQIGDARVIASTSFTDGDGGVAVDQRVQRAPYRLRAIGDQRALSTALSIPGGVLEVLAGKGSKAELTESDNVRVDALARLADPKIARPVPEPSPG